MVAQILPSVKAAGYHLGWEHGKLQASASSVPFSLKMDDSGKVSSRIRTYVCSEVPTTSFLDHQKLVCW